LYRRDKGRFFAAGNEATLHLFEAGAAFARHYACDEAVNASEARTAVCRVTRAISALSESYKDGHR